MRARVVGMTTRITTVKKRLSDIDSNGIAVPLVNAVNILTLEATLSH